MKLTAWELRSLVRVNQNPLLLNDPRRHFLPASAPNSHLAVIDLHFCVGPNDEIGWLRMRPYIKVGAVDNISDLQTRV